MIWVNGAAATGAAAIDAGDRGLLLADGVFDTALVVNGGVVWRAAHDARLVAFCAAIGIAADADCAGLPLARRIGEAMDLASAGMALGSVRVTVTRGPGPRGVAPPQTPRPTVIAARAPMTEPAAFRPLSLWVSGVRRNETSLASRIKSLAYIDSVLETAHARAAGCDEPLFLNTRGEVACSGVGNVFILRGRRLLTPPVEAGALPGVARCAVMQLAPRIGLEAAEHGFTLEELAGADAVYVTNSLRLLAPVTRLGGAPLRARKNVFAGLRALLAAAAGLPDPGER